MKQIFKILILLTFSFQVKAAHIVGGDIYYNYLGNNQYQIFVSVFRDCMSSGAAFDSPLPLGIFFGANNNLFQSIEIPYTGKTNVPVTFNNPCVIPPSNICTENSIYTTIVTLPPNPGGYRIAYTRCCRGPNINNLNNPDDTGLTLTVNIPGTNNNNYQNSSPRFNAYPPMLLCNNDELVFNHAATDPDGDQLVYSLATPFQGGTSFNPMPIPTPNPPYTPVFWANGYSQIQPLGPGSTLSINPTTGMLTSSPNLTGRFVVGIRVDEYRNNVLISSMTRDFIFRVFNCNITMEAILPTQEQLPTFTGYCTGDLNIQFQNNSYGGTNYEWNFGDPTTTADVSTAHTPSYSYPDTGTYQVQLVVNPGWPCTDTAFMEIKLFNALNNSITHNDSLCLLENQFNFTAVTDGPPTTAHSWNFGGNAIQPTASGSQVSTSFTTEGFHQVILTSTYDICEAKDTAVVYVIPQPEANFNMPANYECDGLEVTFINNTQNATEHFWDFDVNGATSTEVNPTYTFPAGGTYEIAYYASSSPLCVDSMFATIVVNEKLEIDFTQSPDQCITGNSFDFIGEVSGPPHATYHYTFDQGASESSVSNHIATGITYSTPGAHIVTLTGQFDNCVETMTSEVFVYKEPTIGFTFVDGLQCQPFLAQFNNLSTADTEMFFEWDFGDGGSSTEEHPAHLYTDHGQFPVTLYISTIEGCADTLSLTQIDLIDINPKPEASFLVDRDHAYICDPVIEFTNTSVGAETYYFNFDDQGNFSHEEHPVQMFYTSGDHIVQMIATSDKGCKDSTFQKIYIEPYSVFIPNTFTPDGDEFNNTFTPKTWQEPVEWELKIFNRWGEMVFQSYNYSIGWDGTYDGKLMQEGMYTYDLRYKPCSIEHNTVKLNGSVSLLR